MGKAPYESYKSGAIREKAGKTPYDLVPIELIEAAAEGFEAGQRKGYPARNWEKGLPIAGTCASIIRHTWALMQGEDIEQPSGQSHINYLAANIAMLAACIRRGNAIEDRRSKTHVPWPEPDSRSQGKPPND